MSVYFDNRQEKREIDQKLLKLLESVIENALERGGIKIPVEVCISLVEDREIQSLNREYRGRDVPTDVLSFPLIDRDDLDKQVPTEIEVLLGDIIISAERADEQAKEYGHSFQRELAYLTVHGILHLLGYDHSSPQEEKVMRAKEEEILEILQIKREPS